MRFNTVELRDKSLIEFASPDSIEPMNVIPRDRIRRVSLQQGSYAERPALQLVVSSFFILLGVFLFLFLRVPGRYSPLAEKGVVLPLIPLLLGGWALRDSLRRGPYLQVELKDGVTRKLRLRAPLDRAHLTRFLDALTALI